MNTRLRLAAAAIALTASATCHAQSADAPSPYIGGSFGIGMIENRAQNLANSIGLPNISNMSTTAATYKFFGGVRVNPQFGIELAYGSLGKYDATATLLSPFSGRWVGSAEGSAFSVTANGYLPATAGVFLYAKGGLARWNLDFKLTDSVNNRSASASGVTPVVGLGLTAALTDKLAARAEVEYFFKVGDSISTGESPVVNVSLGLEYRF